MRFISICVPVRRSRHVKPHLKEAPNLVLVCGFGAFFERELPVAFHQNQRHWAQQEGRVKSISAGFVACFGGEQGISSSLWTPHAGRLQGMLSQAHSQMAALVQPTFGRRPENCTWLLAITICRHSEFHLAGEKEECTKKLLYKVLWYVLKPYKWSSKLLF